MPVNIFREVVTYFEDLQFIPIKRKELWTTHLYCFTSWGIIGRKAHEYLLRSKEVLKILCNEGMFCI